MLTEEFTKILSQLTTVKPENISNTTFCGRFITIIHWFCWPPEVSSVTRPMVCEFCPVMVGESCFVARNNEDIHVVAFCCRWYVCMMLGLN